MRPILLLSFLLSVCLARISDTAPAYENLLYDNVLDNEDFSVFKNPAHSVEIYERRPVPKYIDIDKDKDKNEYADVDEDIYDDEDEDEDKYEDEDEDEEKIPAFGVTREKHNLNKYNVIEAADLTADNTKTDATDKVKQKVDESSFDIKNEVRTYGNDYGDSKNFKYPYAYPVKNNLPEHDNARPSDPKTFRKLLSALLHMHYRKNDTSPYYRRQIWTICANGYRPDSRGRCREILR